MYAIGALITKYTLLIARDYSLFIWNSNLTGHPAFLFAKSANPAFKGIFKHTKVERVVEPTHM